LLSRLAGRAPEVPALPVRAGAPIHHQWGRTEWFLVLQLHFYERQFGAAFSIVGAFCFGLVMAPPERPTPMEAHVGWARPSQMRNEPSQFLDADGDKKGRFDHAAADRLLLFALLEEAALRVASKRARKQARKARASMESVMWRCQACQERASQ
jgi:hypothetical protein